MSPQYSSLVEGPTETSMSRVWCPSPLLPVVYSNRCCNFLDENFHPNTSRAINKAAPVQLIAMWNRITLMVPKENLCTQYKQGVQYCYSQRKDTSSNKSSVCSRVKNKWFKIST